MNSLYIKQYIILLLSFTIIILLYKPNKTNYEHFGDTINSLYTNIPYNVNLYYMLPLLKYLENRDRSVIYDPLVAPERRVPIDQYPFPLLYNFPNNFTNNFTNRQSIINYPTRGYPENYQQVGILSRESDETMLQLFGRPTYPGSNQWEYFVRSEKNGFVNKIPIKSKGNREIEDGVHIHVPGMKDNFKVKIYDYDTYRYNPNIF